jgi:hypothetical protein
VNTCFKNSWNVSKGKILSIFKEKDMNVVQNKERSKEHKSRRGSEPRMERQNSKDYGIMSHSSAFKKRRGLQVSSENLFEDELLEMENLKFVEKMSEVLIEKIQRKVNEIEIEKANFGVEIPQRFDEKSGFLTSWKSKRIHCW